MIYYVCEGCTQRLPYEFMCYRCGKRYCHKCLYEHILHIELA